MSQYYDYEFEGVVSYHDVGSDRYRYTVVYLPEGLRRELPLDVHPRLRISGEINEHPFEAAVTPANGRWYLLTSKALLRKIGAREGDDVVIRFRIADQDAVEVPEALRLALDNDPRLKRLWGALTSGKQRGLAYRVASAKTAPTQAKRITEVFEIIEGKRDFRGKRIEG